MQHVLFASRGADPAEKVVELASGVSKSDKKYIALEWLGLCNHWHTASKFLVVDIILRSLERVAVGIKYAENFALIMINKIFPIAL